jgi:hypothetical protein
MAGSSAGASRHLGRLGGDRAAARDASSSVNAQVYMRRRPADYDEWKELLHGDNSGLLLEVGQPAEAKSPSPAIAAVKPETPAPRVSPWPSRWPALAAANRPLVLATGG